MVPEGLAVERLGLGQGAEVLKAVGKRLEIRRIDHV
jgi:hypothetical protein